MRPLRWPYVAVALVIVLVIGDLRTFVWPPSQSGRSADVVVVLGPMDFTNRVAVAKGLVAQHPTKVLLISTFDAKKDCKGFTPPPGAAAIKCYRPNPYTTQGEARGAAAIARRMGFHSMVVVSNNDQLTRAKLRFERCWSGPLAMYSAPLSLHRRLRFLPYENGATLKALVLQPTC